MTVSNLLGNTTGEDVDSAEPPRVVLESRELCSDAAVAQMVFRQGLAHARAPARGWLVTMRVEPGRVQGHVLSAEGDIVSSEGVNVAHRFLSGTSSRCAGLARAFGVWASLVLDAELARTLAPPAAPEPSAPPSPSDHLFPSPKRVPSDTGGEPSLPGDNSVPREEPRHLEIGAGAFIMAQSAGRPFAGISPYVVVNAVQALLIRASAAAGEALPQTGPDAQWFAARVDACSRWQGLYASSHGLELTYCGGTEGGFTYERISAGAPTQGYWSVGPSIDLQGDIADNVAAVMRGAGGVSIYPLGWLGRFELGLSWRMP